MLINKVVIRIYQNNLYPLRLHYFIQGNKLSVIYVYVPVNTPNESILVLTSQNFC